MENKQFVVPEVEIIKLDKVDVIATSNGIPGIPWWGGEGG